MKTVLLLFACLFVTHIVQAEAIKQPPSLEAGQQYRLAFVTSETTTAESDDIDKYNAFVQAVADAAPISEWGLEWNAIGSTETVSARENTATHPVSDASVPIFLLDGTELVPSYPALWNANNDRIIREFDVNELGVPFNSPDPPLLAVWTGTFPDGTPGFLSDTGDITGGPLGAGTHSYLGFGDRPSESWLTSTAFPHDFELRMYAMSEVLTAIPEPNNSAHFFIVLAACLLVRERSLVEIHHEVPVNCSAFFSAVLSGSPHHLR